MAVDYFSLLTILRKSLAGIAIVVVPIIVIGLTWDTIDAFWSPEKYKFIQYKVNWESEGFYGYIIRNLSFIISAIIFWISSLKILKNPNPNLIWKSIFYLAWLFILFRLCQHLIK
jgi:hypothetical protein